MMGFLISVHDRRFHLDGQLLPVQCFLSVTNQQQAIRAVYISDNIQPNCTHQAAVKGADYQLLGTLGYQHFVVEVCTNETSCSQHIVQFIDRFIYKNQQQQSVLLLENLGLYSVE